MSNPAHDALMNLGDNPEENVRQLARRYQSMFSDPLILEDLKQKFFHYDTPLDERFTEARVGSQQVVQYILKMISLDTSTSLEQTDENKD